MRDEEGAFPVFSSFLFYFSEIFSFSEVRTEEKIDEKSDDRQQEEDEQPGDGPVGIALFEKDNARNKDAVCPEKTKGILFEEIHYLLWNAVRRLAPEITVKEQSGIVSDRLRI